MKTMNNTLARGVGAIALAAALGALQTAVAQVPFATPQAAADTMIEAIAIHDGDGVSRLLGKNWRALLPVGEIDPDDVTAFLQMSSQARNVRVDGNRALLTVGTDPWTLPIPIVRGKDGQWRFDAAGGRRMLTERRIGANERAAIQAALAYVDAQREYALADHDGDGVLEYARKFISSAGKRDGLIWSAKLGDDSPLGEGFLPARAGDGYHGYAFRILTSQGRAAKGGARDYLIGKNMSAGFALLAWPVKYGATGVMSFIVGSDGVVYERNLGPDTGQAAAGITKFDPDTTWNKVNTAQP